MRIAFLYLFLPLTACPALSQEFTPQGAARTASLFAAIGGECAKVANINHEVVQGFLDAAIQVGRKSLGKAKFDKMAMQEVDRRLKEVNATGLEAWCSYQRGNMRQMGVSAFND